MNWKIWVPVIVIFGSFGFMVLRQQGNGKSDASFEGLGLKIAVNRENLDPNGNSKSNDSEQSDWVCLQNGEPIGKVGIWWGHTSKDAAWACNHWNSTCGNGGGCIATRI